MNSVWDRVVVNDEELTRTISELRSALGDTAREKKYVRTVPKRGYELISPIDTLGITDISEIEQPECLVIPSLAVLPFLNRSSDSANEYFSDGLTEELITALAQIRGLHVSASTSAFSFKSRQMDIKEIGHTLGVTHILEGSVRKTNRFELQRNW